MFTKPTCENGQQEAKLGGEFLLLRRLLQSVYGGAILIVNRSLSFGVTVT